MRRLGVIILAAALAGCGFTPMYAEPAVGSSLRRIAVTTQDDRLGYRLREQLEAAIREVTKLRGQVQVVRPGSLPNDGKVIEDARSYQ